MFGPAEPPGNVGPVLLDPRACQACVGPGRRTCFLFKRAWVRAIGPDLSLSVRGPEPSDPRHSQERAGPLSSTHLPVQHEWVRGNGRWRRFRTLRYAKWEPRKRNKHRGFGPQTPQVFIHGGSV